MTYRFMYAYICERTGRKHHFGCDSRILDFCDKEIVWKGYCVCGMSARLRKIGEAISVQHVGEPTNVTHINFARKRKDCGVLAFKQEGNILKHIPLDKVDSDPEHA